MKKRVRKYGDKQSQCEKVNRYVTIGMCVFYLLIFINVYTAFSQGIRSAGYTAVMGVMNFALAAVNVVVYLRNKYSKYLRVVAMCGLFVVDFFILMAFTSHYLKFLALAPLIGCVLYYDKKLLRNSCVIIAAINFFCFYNSMYIEHKVKPEQLEEYIGVLFSVIVLLFIIFYTNYVGYRFNHDALYNLLDEKAVQQEMLDDIINIAGKVREGTQTASDIMLELDESSKEVQIAANEIFSSTESTAANIMEQTVMTQKIQTSIEETVTRSENMVMTASHSEQEMEKNVQTVARLKEHSYMIEETNHNVGDAMNRLQEKMTEVKNITSVIYDISNQTNLLALNASIESARAGEAGRGFAVVAEEIRKLAEETRKETENISQILEKLNDYTSEARMAVEKSVNGTKEQESLINTMSDGFQIVRSNVDSLSIDVASIDQMLTHLLLSNHGIVDNITQISASTEEVTASSKQAAEMSENNSANADQVKDILEDIVKISFGLDKYIHV